MSQNEIFTIDARDYIFFDVVKDMGVTDSNFYDYILSSFKTMVDVLKTKNISYTNLKSALVPNANKNEICLFFDASKTIDKSVYGVEIMDEVIPLLKEVGTCSVLHGDYIWNKNENKISTLEESIHYVNYANLREARIFCVYINNLTENMFESIKAELLNYSVYVGFVDTTRASFVKWYLSSMLSGFIKYKNLIIMGHEDDRDNSENVNMTIYPFPKYEFTSVSLQDKFFSPFLSYKIERPVFPGFEIDEEIAFVALSGESDSFVDYSVEITPDKFKHFKTYKKENLQNAGIDDLSRDELCTLLKQNLRKNYIFRFKKAPDSALCFGTVVELSRKNKKSYRLTVAMKVDIERKNVNVTSLY